jgi:hypothetical protein
MIIDIQETLNQLYCAFFSFVFSVVCGIGFALAITLIPGFSNNPGLLFFSGGLSWILGNPVYDLDLVTSMLVSASIFYLIFEICLVLALGCKFNERLFGILYLDSNRLRLVIKTLLNYFLYTLYFYLFIWLENYWISIVYLVALIFLNVYLYLRFNQSLVNSLVGLHKKTPPN